ncbi:MAG: HEPN domain-containing protein [Defluviitaleaceae bacterium]|nr:HEPN domain-containing protein [Defluviitaleaceae bacterium]
MQHAKDMSKYRFDKAEQCLVAAKALINIGDYFAAANRSYYCIFHAMRSVMALRGVDFGNHGQVIGYFRREFIKTGIFPKVMSNTIETLFQVRNESDYDDFYILSKDEVTNQLISAESFLDEIKKYLDRQDEVGLLN